MKTIRLTFLLLFVPSVAHAQESYSAILERALANHPKIAAAKAAIEMERAGKSELLSPFRPMLSLNGFLAGGDGTETVASTVEPINYAMLLPGGVAMGNVMLMWKVWTGGRESAARGLGDARVKASEHMLSAVEQDVVLALRLAYSDYFFRLGALDAAKADAEAARETERITIEGEKAGKMPKAFVLRASAAARKAEKEVAMAESDLAAAKAMLDEAAGGPVQVGGTFEASASGAPSDLATALQLGAERSELKFFLAMAEAQGLEASLVRRSLRPDVSLFGMGGTMQRDGGMSDTTAKFGLVVSVPLSDGGMRSAKSRMLQAKAKEFMAQAEQMRLQVRREIESAWAELVASEQVQVSARAELASATESYEVEKLRFEGGKSTMAELLDARAALAQARIGVLDAERFTDSARAKLIRAIGGASDRR